MAFVSSVGRLLFASVFLLSAWQEFNEFGSDGGPAAKFLRPKLDVFSSHLLTHTGMHLPKQLEIKHLVAAAIVLKGVGGLLFIFGSSFGAVLLLLHQAIATPILYDFYNYDAEKKEFNQLFLKFTQVTNQDYLLPHTFVYTLINTFVSISHVAPIDENLTDGPFTFSK
ncbi:PREDICTED: uncharacterized protein LOC101310402 isoform 1 [Fragaria vesca subsp. vesca]